MAKWVYGLKCAHKDDGFLRGSWNYIKDARKARKDFDRLMPNCAPHTIVRRSAWSKHFKDWKEVE